ncbi:MAG TPA: RHS repeat-associated core domain-containing protein [Candidatus Limnocylindrales bacterium]|nr:RHS repeat-associated core domain-containing protein [Candidatus Limnocylindrales bacterium]
MAGWEGAPFDATRVGLGGWSLDALAWLDPTSGTFVAVDGRPRRSNVVTPSTGPAAGQLAVATPDGLRVQIFDPAGRHLRTLDALTGAAIWTFEYDDKGRLQTAHERSGVVATIERDGDGRPTAIVSSMGPRTALVVDGAGYLSQIDVSGRGGIGIEARPDGLVVGRTDPGGYRQSFEYDATGRLVAATDATDGTTKYVGEAAPTGVTLTVTGPAGVVTKSEFPSQSNGATKRIVTSSIDGRTEVTVSPDGRREVEFSDGRHLVERRIPDVRWGLQVPVLQERELTTPGGLGQVIVGSQTVRLRDPADPLSLEALSETLTVAGAAYQRTFAASTRTLTLVAPGGRQRSVELDKLGRAVRVASTGQPPVALEYDDVGRTRSISVGDGDQQRTFQMRHHDGEGVLELVDPEGRLSRVQYDEGGRPVWYTLPTQNLVETRLDASDRLLGETAPSGATFVATYDPAGRPTGLTGPDGAPLVERRLGRDGRVLELSTPAGSVAMSYDDGGRLIGMSQPGGDSATKYGATTSRPMSVDAASGSLAFTWDGPLVTEQRWSGDVNGTVGLAYDERFRPSALRVNDNEPVALAYTGDGRPTRAGAFGIDYDQSTGHPATERLGGLAGAWRYDALGRVAGLVVKSGGTTVFEAGYERNGAGLVTGEVVTSAGETARETYAYDAAGRLTRAVHNGNATTFGYDENGNRTVVKTLAGSVTATFDTLDRVTSQGSILYDYDGVGQLAHRVEGKRTTAYTYDLLGRLLQVKLPDGRVVDYVLDGIGRRIGKRVDGKLVNGLLYLDPTRPVAELAPDGRVASTFVYAGDARVPAYMLRDGVPFAILTDARGSPRLVVDATTGKVAQRLDYDALGRVIRDTKPGFQPFGFAGGLYDPDTHLVRFGARDYDAETGRWTAPDPIGLAAGDPNLYRYVRGDPVNLVDPSGLADCPNGPLTFGVSGGVNIGLGASGDTPSDAPTGIFSGGWNIQYIPGHGVAIFAYGSPEDPAESGGGVAFGGGLSANIGHQLGPAPAPGDEAKSWEGPFDSIGAGLGPGGIETYKSAGEPCSGSDPSYEGIDLGSGFGLPTAFYKKRTNYKCLFGCSRSIGDPHLFTSNGLQYEFQTVGEFVALQSDSGDLRVQVRQEPYGESRAVSINTAIALSVAGDRVVMTAVKGQGTTPRLVIDGRPTTIITPTQTLPHGGSIERADGGGYDVVWPDGSRIGVTVHLTGALDVLVDLAGSRKGSVRGLLGSPDTGPTSELVTRDGKRLALPRLDDPTYRHVVYETFGESWRVRQDETLFDYAPGNSTKTFTDRSFPDEVTTTSQVPADVAARATDLCRRAGVTDPTFLEGCVFDVGLTGDPGFAVSTAGIQDQALPPPKTDEFSISVGDLVGADLPNPGAGRIDRDERDLYHFRTLTAGFVFLGTRTLCATAAPLRWSLLDSAGEAVGNVTHSTSAGICSDLGRLDLPRAGEYTVAVDGDPGARGTYGFALLAGTSESTMDIALGDTVSRGVPSVGAGEIAAAGEIDRFRFRAEAGETIYLETMTGSLPHCGDIGWRLIDPDGSEVPLLPANTCLDLGRHTVVRGGSYLVELESPSGATGEYGFTVWRVPPAGQFNLAVGDAVNEGAPGAGAGRIESPGAIDRYYVPVQTGQSISLEPLSPSTDCGPIRWMLIDPSGAVVYSNEVLCAGIDRPAKTMTQSGKAEVRVFGDGAQTGAYSFRVTSP